MNRWKHFALAFVLVTLVLAALFRHSFEQALVLFANDSPLGALVGYFEPTFTYFTGAWHHLNWIGVEQPSALPNVTYAVMLLIGPVAYAKFMVPLSLLLLGLSAWLLFRVLRFPGPVCALGALAAALNGDAVSYACWGLPYLPLTLAATFFALAAAASIPRGYGWIKAILAGMAVGLSIMEGYDNGAIFSLYIGGFVVFQEWAARRQEEGKAPGAARAFARLGVVAVCAALFAAHGLATLIGTQIQGVAATQKDQQTPQQRWDAATQWSLPKAEALRVIVPGLFGYRLDTPEGGQYWGSVGRTPGWEQHRQGLARHSGSGTYAGVFVVLMAFWALARSLRMTNSPYSPLERKFIWFWSVAAFLSLLFAFGRHAPFYQIIYSAPFFSTIRNPIKFLHPLHLALLVLFGYGLAGLWRSYVATGVAGAGSAAERLKQWWKRAPAFDRRTAQALAVALGAAMLAWFIYVRSRAELETHLRSSGFAAAEAGQVVKFSIIEAGQFVLFLGLSAAVVTAVMTGMLAGVRARWAVVAMAALIAVDLARANQPWIHYYDYKEKLASNEIFEFLRKDAWTHRVTSRLSPFTGNYLVGGEQADLFSTLQNEWLQHHFQYYQIQSVDVIQMPRMQERDSVFGNSFLPKTNEESHLLGRLWQLTNTRFLLGHRGYVDRLNQLVDPARQRFKLHTAFDLAAKPSVQQVTRLEDLTVAVRTNGQHALIEFEGALPRAHVARSWEVLADDQAVLARLREREFDPGTTVVVSGPAQGLPAAQGTGPGGAAKIVKYEPKRVEIEAECTEPALLLLNDRYSPYWKVFVDGKQETLLRCNYIMRGVYLDRGTHTVRFEFDPPSGTLYVSLAAAGAGLLLCGFLFRQGASGRSLRP